MDASIEKALNSLGDAVKESLGREGQILSAVDAFRVLLRQQLERIDHMNTDKVDFSTKDVVTIGLIDGDGIGAVISPQARRVLEALLADEIRSGRIILKQIQGLTIENRLALGQSVPQQVLEQIRQLWRTPHKGCGKISGRWRSMAFPCLPRKCRCSVFFRCR